MKVVVELVPAACDALDRTIIALVMPAVAPEDLEPVAAAAAVAAAVAVVQLATVAISTVVINLSITVKFVRSLVLGLRRTRSTWKVKSTKRRRPPSRYKLIR